MKKRKSKSRKAKKKSQGLIYLIFLVIGITSAGLFYYFSSQAKTTAKNFNLQIPQGYEFVGLDISHHQGDIDWKNLFVDNGFDTIIDFVYSKVTEGNSHLDTKYRQNRLALNEFGILNGAYHYFKPKEPPRPQAFHFLNNYDARSIDLPPVLDVEEEGFSDSDLLAKVKIWCNEVEKRLKVKPIIYTSLSFYETKFRGEMDEFKFWIAAYSREPQYMTDKNVLHWQFTETGQLPGIQGKVDINVSKGIGF